MASKAVRARGAQKARRFSLVTPVLRTHLSSIEQRARRRLIRQINQHLCEVEDGTALTAISQEKIPFAGRAARTINAATPRVFESQTTATALKAQGTNKQRSPQDHDAGATRDTLEYMYVHINDAVVTHKTSDVPSLGNTQD